MWPDRVTNPGPLAHESDALPTALRGPASAPGSCGLVQVVLQVLNILYRRQIESNIGLRCRPRNPNPRVNG